MSTADDPLSPLAEATRRIGERWTLLVVQALLAGHRRFGEISDAVAGIAPNVLTKRLRQLEADGLVRSVPYSRRPVRVEYELTESGTELAGALALLSEWGLRQSGSGHLDPSHTDSSAATHDACGTTMQTRLWCPTCDRVVASSEEDELYHL